MCNVGKVYIFEHRLYVSALEHARTLILSNYVLLASIQTINIYFPVYNSSLTIIMYFVNNNIVIVFIDNRQKYQINLNTLAGSCVLQLTVTSNYNKGKVLL